MAFLSLGDQPAKMIPFVVFTGCGNLFTRFLHLIPHGQQPLAPQASRNWVLVQRCCAVAESDQTLERLWSTSCSFSAYIVPHGIWSWVQILTLLHTSGGPWANHLNSLIFSYLFHKKGIITWLLWKHNSTVCKTLSAYLSKRSVNVSYLREYWAG